MQYLINITQQKQDEEKMLLAICCCKEVKVEQNIPVETTLIKI